MNPSTPVLTNKRELAPGNTLGLMPSILLLAPLSSEGPTEGESEGGRVGTDVDKTDDSSLQYTRFDDRAAESCLGLVGGINHCLPLEVAIVGRGLAKDQWRLSMLLMLLLLWFGQFLGGRSGHAGDHPLRGLHCSGLNRVRDAAIVMKVLLACNLGIVSHRWPSCVWASFDQVKRVWGPSLALSELSLPLQWQAGIWLPLLFGVHSGGLHPPSIAHFSFGGGKAWPLH